MSFPPPNSAEIAHSKMVLQHIQYKIKTHGAMDFATYMQAVLYAPGLGYYSAGAHKFGHFGDFITAPEISPLFGFCIARQCQQILTALSNADILEIGAGSGKLAGDILHFLQQQKILPAHYYILEVSAELKQRQQNYLQQHLPSILFSRCRWIDSLEDWEFSGIIIANEVLDALPVHLFKIEKGIQEFFVTAGVESLHWRWMPAHPNLIQAVNNLKIAFDEGYCSEINLVLMSWLAALSAVLKQGIILLFDYGFTRQEYYHPERRNGTLMCYYRHHAHTDPLQFIGLQDITAHVDFTAVAEAAEKLHLSVMGYTTQANFLLNMKITELLSTLSDDLITQTNARQAIKKLLFPGEMGEIYKVMALTRQLTVDLQGFKEFH